MKRFYTIYETFNTQGRGYIPQLSVRPEQREGIKRTENRSFSRIFVCQKTIKVQTVQVEYKI